MEKKQVMEKKRFPVIRTLCVIILFVIGIGLIFADQYSGKVVEYQTAQAVEQVKEATVEEIKQNTQEDAPFEYAALDALRTEDILATALSGAKIKPIGLIAVPSVGVHLPIAKGVTNVNMSVGAGTLKPDQQMGYGNYVLASHHLTKNYNDNLLFGPLLRVADGASIYITDKEYIYEYKVYYRETVAPTRVDLVDDVDGVNIITLITCDDDGATRFIVRGELTQMVPIDAAPQEMKDAFQLPSNAWNG